MLTQFRQRYPQGSLTSELLTIDCGQYVVRVSLQVGGITLATGLAAARLIEEAEDKARQRALETLDFSSEPPKIVASSPESAIATPDLEVKTNGVSSSLKESKVADSPSIAPIKEESSPESPILPSEPENIPQPVSTEASPIATPEPEPELELVSTPKPEPEVELISTPEPEPELGLISTPESEPELELISTPESEPELELISKPEPEPEATAVATVTETAPASSTVEEEAEELDFSEIIARSNAELKRLRWTQEEGRDYLIRTYGKRSRQLLSDEELLEFLHYLQGLPTH